MAPRQSSKTTLIKVDLLIDLHIKLIPVEIKASETISQSFFGSILQWNEISGTDAANNYIIYGSLENQNRQQGKVLSWRSTGTFIDSLSE